MIFRSLSVGSLQQTNIDAGIVSSHCQPSDIGTQHMRTHRFLMLSSSFQISAPVLVIILSSGKSDGSSVTIYHVPLNR
jgi:hypothetical protein